MKWEETVMTSQQLSAVDEEIDTEGVYDRITDPEASEYYYHKKFAEKQAEISFKSGMREVVAWVESNMLLKWHYPAWLKDSLYDKAWQAFLKERGLSDV